MYTSATTGIAQPTAQIGRISALCAKAVGRLIAWSLRLGFWSWRKDTGESARIDALLADGKRLLAVFWHGKYLPLFPLLAGRKASIFTTPCFRGRIVAEICRQFGYNCHFVPSAGGKPARAAMVDAMRFSNAAAFAIDGPLGPAHKVKRGAFEISAELGFALLPVSASARRRLIFRRRWDHAEIPWPFTRVALTVGEPIEPPLPLSGGAVPGLKQRLHDALESLGQRADDIASGRPPGSAPR